MAHRADVRALAKLAKPPVQLVCAELWVDVVRWARGRDMHYAFWSRGFVHADGTRIGWVQLASELPTLNNVELHVLTPWNTGRMRSLIQSARRRGWVITNHSLRGVSDDE